MATGGVRTRNPGTNAFLNPQNPDPNSNLMTFSADGTAKQGCCCGFKKRQTSQKRAFQKVDARDLAGKWRGCLSIPIMGYWPLSPIFCTTKKALNEYRYEESGLTNCLCLPCSDSGTRTRVYVNGHPTNGFDDDGTWYRYDAWYYDDATGSWFVQYHNPDHIEWHRDAGCAGDSCSFAKKVG